MTYPTSHPNYIKLAAILDQHGLMSDKEDLMIQDILKALFLNPLDLRKYERKELEKEFGVSLGAPSHKRFHDHGIDTIGDELD